MQLYLKAVLLLTRKHAMATLFADDDLFDE
jgi:hypothetical protein